MPACFALPSGTAPRKRTFHQGTSRRRTVCPDSRSKRHDATNHPAHQRHAAFTPACFALLSGTAPRKHTSRRNPNGAATSRTSCRHMVCPDTRSKRVTRCHKSSRSPATRRVYASLFRAPQWHGATQTHFPPRPRKSQWRCNMANVVLPHGLSTHLKQT